MNSKKGFALLILLIVIAVIAIGGSAYIYSNNEQPVQVASTSQATSTSITNTYFEVPELGIQFKVPGEIKDLKYRIQKSPKTAWFSTETLSKLDTYCGADSAPLGVVIVYDAKPSDSSGTEVFEVNGKYITYTHPQATCSDNKSVQDVTIQQIAQFRQSLKTIELISPKVSINSSTNTSILTDLEIANAVETIYKVELKKDNLETIYKAINPAPYTTFTMFSPIKGDLNNDELEDALVISEACGASCSFNYSIVLNSKTSKLSGFMITKIPGINLSNYANYQDTIGTTTIKSNMIYISSENNSDSEYKHPLQTFKYKLSNNQLVRVN